MSAFTRSNEDCGVATRGSTDDVDGTSSSAAMTLWQKFANWQNEMEECRSKVRNVRQHKEQVMLQISELQTVRKEEQMKIEQFKTSESSCAEPSLGMLQNLRCQLDEEDKKYRAAVLFLQKNEQQLAAKTDQRQVSMQQIINQSHQFRWECQQVQLQLKSTVPAEDDFRPPYLSNFSEYYGFSRDTSSTAHSLQASLYAFLASKPNSSETGTEDPWITQMLQDLEFIATESADAVENVDENDPYTWTFIHENDLDFHQVVAEYKRQKDSFDDANQELQALQKQQAAVQSKAQDRHQRKVQLQEQLRRLQSECSSMDEEVVRYQQFILDDEALSHTYREKIDQRNRRQTGNAMNLRISLNTRNQSSLDDSRFQQQSFRLLASTPSTQAGQSEANLVAKTQVQFKNPYAPSRKHALDAVSDPKTRSTGIEPTQHGDRNQEDLAAAVLGRPSQRLKQPDHDTRSLSFERLDDVSTRKNRGRNFRNSLRFRLYAGISNCDGGDNDGDVAAGTVSLKSNEALDKEFDNDCEIQEDEDVLNFIAFSSSRSTSA